MQTIIRRTVFTRPFQGLTTLLCRRSQNMKVRPSATLTPLRMPRKPLIIASLLLVGLGFMLAGGCPVPRGQAQAKKMTDGLPRCTWGTGPGKPGKLTRLCRSGSLRMIHRYGNVGLTPGSKPTQLQAQSIRTSSRQRSSPTPLEGGSKFTMILMGRMGGAASCGSCCFPPSSGRFWR
jgi:hypothetical protein